MTWSFTRAVALGAAMTISMPALVGAQEASEEQRYAAAQKSLAAGDYETALKGFSELSRAHPKVAELHATLGAVLFQQGDYNEALKELNEAKRLKPALPKIDGLIAMSQAELGRFAEALPQLVKTFRATDEQLIKRLIGLQLERAYTALHRDADAVQVGLELQRLFPKDAEVLYHNERVFGNLAYLTVQQLVEAAPDSVWRYQAQAEALESQGSHDSAIAEYREVLGIDPSHRGVHYRIGRALREGARDNHQPGALDAAMKEFQEELKLDPTNADAAYEIGELNRLDGHLDEAKTYFETALREHPDFPEANLGLGTVLALMHQPEAALPHLQEALKADPNDEATWYRLSQVERSLGHADEGKKAMERFLALRKAALRPKPQAEHDVSKQEVSDTETQ